MLTADTNTANHAVSVTAMFPMTKAPNVSQLFVNTTRSCEHIPHVTSNQHPRPYCLNNITRVSADCVRHYLAKCTQTDTKQEQ
jgi:hypothetical protein